MDTNQLSTTPDDEERLDSTAADEESFAALFAASLQEQSDSFRRGDILKGVIVALDGDQVIVDVGAKAEGAVALSDFSVLGLQPKVGDEVEATVISTAEGLKLSVLEMRKQELWVGIEQAQAEGSALTAKVVAEVKGGFRVELGGIKGFMPKSESDLDVRHANAAALVGKSIEVAVIEATHKPENVVVSRKRLLSAKAGELRADFFGRVKVGDRLSGEIKRLADFGAFVDLGGVDGLLHVSDMAWRRINHPSELFSIGQKVTAEVIKLNAETGKVSLSTKSLQADPWEHAATTYEPGMRLTGTVRRLLDFGAVVELEAGVEGMIHRSELSWTKKDAKPSEVLAEGDVVDVSVLEVEPKERRIRLSLKEVSENPWQAWLAAHPVGTHISGPIRGITEFGFFVGLGEGLDGLVHIGNLSWDRKGEEAIKEYKKGQQVECAVLGVDIARQRISLGIKQLHSDPFELFLAGAQRGGRVNGKVVEAVNGALIVEIGEGVRGRLALREVPREMGELKVGTEVEAKVIELDRKRRQIDLSIRQMQRDDERDAVRNYSQKAEEKGPSALALELQRKLLGKG